MTDDEAEALLVKLSEHYKTPVMPVTRYCKSFEQWREALDNRVRRHLEKLYPDVKADRKSPEYEAAWKLYHQEKAALPEEEERRRRVGRLRDLEQDMRGINQVSLMIRKSSLLFRLIYCGEKLRPTMCPEHKGEWSGLEMPPIPEHGIEGNVCPHGCHLTGWIPER